ncbi:Two-component nitrogen fixation transcriptional regulator FixJ [Fimbriiglobus ruber]|uniref:Two-component nitrogen fixation transcriptional regulator FixJ n=1 Tax=Fimbriiglobus ruber TaxID=1908690 RepID=A0A225E6H0_9BACT|nr:Two-component nitrogen fixation transcriptional regulator FixJ [Fimbriiglobus ruber]
MDDDEAIRKALTTAGKLIGRPVRSFASADEFLAGYDPAVPGCLVLDIKMPGMTGVELQRKLIADGTAIPVIVVSGHADVRIAVEVMSRGAVTLLEKPFRLDELLAHIRTAIETDAVNRAKIAERAETESRLAALTPKELEVLDLIVSGKTNKDIAAVLGLSLRAVEDRRARLMKKAEARSIADLIRLRDSLAEGDI